jgi:hypothetical protein
LVAIPPVDGVDGFGRGSVGRAAGLGVGQHGGDHFGDVVHLGGAEAAGGQGGRSDPDAGGVPGAVGVAGNGVAVDDNAGFEQGRFGLPPGESVGGDIEEREVAMADDLPVRRPTAPVRPDRNCFWSAGPG